MKLAALSLLLLVSFAAQANAAEDILKVDDAQVRLLGSGVMDSETHAVLALACTGDRLGEDARDCSDLRWAIHFNDGETYFLPRVRLNLWSNLFENPLDPSGLPQGKYKKSLQTELKDYWKAFRKSERETQKNEKNHLTNILGYTDAGLVVTGGVIFFATGAPAILAVGGGLWGAWLISGLFDFRPSVAFMKLGDRATQEQKGWSWAENPKEFQHAVFSDFVYFILENDRSDYTTRKMIFDKVSAPNPVKGE